MYYILIDEVQYAITKKELENPEDVKLYNVLNGLMHLRNVDIYVTGSNSKLLSQDVMTAFRGRGDQVQVFPLGFSYDDANVCDKIADIEIPVLVINSEADTLTPQFMGQEIYDSIQNEEIKMIWTVTDSEHTEIWLDHNQEYREKVQELLNFTK